MESWVLDKLRRAKAERWRFLDLGNAGLTQLPPELFELEALEGLNLSGGYNDFETSEWRDSKNVGEENAIAAWPEDIARLTSLRILIALGQPSANVEPLAKLANLTSLDLRSTQVSDVEPLAKLANLTSLNLSSTQVSDVEPLAKLANLTSLDLSATQVSDVEPLAKLANLTSLDLSHCRLRAFPQFVLEFADLENLYLSGNPIEDCTPEVFEADYPGCLAAARTHFTDQAAGKIADRELKLILLGNGRVGKSSIAKRLIQDDFNPHEPSTHAIRLEEWPLDIAEQKTRINVWDFGGQDIYHGTHALFLKSRAVFVIVWDRFSEDGTYIEEGLPPFENRPLAYWLDYVRAVSPHAAVIVVENKCDDGRGSTPSAELGGLPLVHFSAQEGHGRESLTAHIKEAAQRVLGQTAAHEIGIGRWAVKQTLRRYQREDEPRPSAEKQHRRITRQHFDELCAEQGAKISSADELLKFLHNTGVLYHEPHLFHGDIILDQRWAIEAIYTLFHRQTCYRQLRERHGRFKLTTLNDLAWEAAGFTHDDQRLFLSFMQSCSLCFRISEQRNDEDPDEVEYLAPELLPERETLRKQIELRTRLYDVSNSVWFRYRHRFLHQGIMQRFLVRVGELFRADALYWKDGVLLESATQHALAEIECQRKLDGNPARGAIVLHVRGPGRESLLNQLRNELERLHDAGTEVDQHASLDGTEWVDLEKLPDALIVGQIVSDQRRALDAQPFRFLQHRDRDDRLTGPYEAPENLAASPSRGRDRSDLRGQAPVYISYCRRDDRTRVDRLYESLKAAGHNVRRDDENLEYKGRISDFMTELGRGACVITVISDLYLRSSFCMWELLNI